MTEKNSHDARDPDDIEGEEIEEMIANGIHDGTKFVVEELKRVGEAASKLAGLLEGVGSSTKEPSDNPEKFEEWQKRFEDSVWQEVRDYLEGRYLTFKREIREFIENPMQESEEKSAIRATYMMLMQEMEHIAVWVEAQKWNNDSGWYPGRDPAPDPKFSTKATPREGEK